MSIKKGDRVTWKWGNGTAEGTVKNVATDRVEITSKGKKIAKNGTNDNPAIVINHSSGDDVLKLASELQTSTKNN